MLYEQHDAAWDPSAGLSTRTIPAGFWAGWALGNLLAATEEFQKETEAAIKEANNQKTES